MRPTIVIACLIGAVSAEITQEEADQQNKDADCINHTFLKSFPGGSCTNDAACMCNLQQYRQDWLCMIAKKCRPEAFYDQIATIRSYCEGFNKPTSLDFDTQAICGIKQPVATGRLYLYPTSSTSSAPAAQSSSASGDKSNGASSAAAAATSSGQAAAATSGVSSAQSSGASSSSPSSAKETPSSQASSASSGAAPSKSADAKTGSGSVLTVSNLAAVLAGVGLAL